MTTLAYDRRTFDSAGHLFRPGCRLTRATVSDYMGRECPGADALGFHPDRLYPLLRDPQELKRAAPSFENKPLTISHRALSANDHDPEIVCGSVSSIEWDGTFLSGDLSIWTAEAIDLVQSGRQEQLSCSYKYTIDPTPGVFEGMRYVGIMRNIEGNHVSLVEMGRLGAQCIVGDSAPNLSTFKRREPMAYQQAIQEMQAIRQAEQDVAPIVGEVLGMDSALGVYRTALQRLGHNYSTSDLGNTAGARAIFNQARRAGSQGQVRQAYDSGASARREHMFPNANRLNRQA